VEPIAITLREPCPCCDGPMRIIEIFRHHAPCNGRLDSGTAATACVTSLHPLISA
jgi:hypothetical protein